MVPYPIPFRPWRDTKKYAKSVKIRVIGADFVLFLTQQDNTAQGNTPNVNFITNLSPSSTKALRPVYNSEQDNTAQGNTPNANFITNLSPNSTKVSASSLPNAWYSAAPRSSVHISFLLRGSNLQYVCVRAIALSQISYNWIVRCNCSTCLFASLPWP